MMRHAPWFAPLALIAAPAVAEDKMTPVEAAAIELAIERGQLMYVYDQAAWHGTDDMVAQMKASGNYEKLAPTIGGWVVDGPADAPVVTFFSKDESAPRAVYRATMTAGGAKVARGELSGGALTPAQLALAKAVRAARAKAGEQKIGLCNDRNPNSVALPPAAPGGPTLVYFMTPQTQAETWPMGGHWRFEVDADGNVVQSRKFANSCISVGGVPPNGASRPAALFISHVLDPTPTEIHVFTMLSSGIPVAVGTKDQVWMIQRVNGRLRITAQKLKR